MYSIVRIVLTVLIVSGMLSSTFASTMPSKYQGMVDHYSQKIIEYSNYEVDTVKDNIERIENALQLRDYTPMTVQIVDAIIDAMEEWIVTMESTISETCPLFPCAAPPTGCSYAEPEKDKNGCATGCGALECEDCVTVECARPPDGCEYVDIVYANGNSCQITCGTLVCS